MVIGDSIIVKDTSSGITLMHGKISKITDNPAGYSIDGILFVNPNSKKIAIIKSENILLEQVYNTACESDRYITYKHNNIDNTFEYDFFMWDEIELEVKEVCELLNQIPGIETYSSCSGHGVIPPYVDFYIHDYNAFCDMLDFLRESNVPSKTDKHNDIYTTHRFVMGVEGRGTCHLESLEINSKFQELCEVLKRYITKQKIKI
jgi:hypothetical protein